MTTVYIFRLHPQDDTDSTLGAVAWLRTAAHQALPRASSAADAAASAAACPAGVRAQVVGAADALAAARADEAAAAAEELDWLGRVLVDDRDPRWGPAAGGGGGGSGSGTGGSAVSGRARAAAAAALSFEEREAKPTGWRRFAWAESSDEELRGDGTSPRSLRLSVGGAGRCAVGRRMLVEEGGLRGSWA